MPAGDMLLGALIDAGAPLDRVESAVSALAPGEVALRTSTVHRAGLRALKVEVESRADEHPHRSWAHIRGMLETAELPSAVRTTALAAFERLADAEARVHGVVIDVSSPADEGTTRSQLLHRVWYAAQRAGLSLDLRVARSRRGSDRDDGRVWSVVRLRRG